MHTYTAGQTQGGAKSLPSRMQRADLLYNHTRSGLAVALQGTQEYHQLLNTAKLQHSSAGTSKTYMNPCCRSATATGRLFC